MSYYNSIDYSNVQQYHLTSNNIEMASPSQNSPGIGSGAGGSAAGATNTSATATGTKTSNSDTTSQVCSLS